MTDDGRTEPDKGLMDENGNIIEGKLRNREDTLMYDRFEFKRQSTERYGKKVSRVFAKYLIRKDYEKPENQKTNAFYVPRVMNFEQDKEDREFWLKAPSCLKQSTDSDQRLLFAAG